MKPCKVTSYFSTLLMLSLLLLGSIAYAFSSYTGKQSIDISISLTQLDIHPTFSMIVKNEDSGAVIPYLFTIDQKNLYQYLQIDGSHFSIQDMRLTYRDQPIAICHISQETIFDKASLNIMLTGSLTEKSAQLPCSYRAVAHASVIDLRGYTPPTAVSTNDSSSTDTNLDSNHGYKGLVKYLNALKSCRKGNYPAKVNDTLITYAIKGKLGRDCRVEIMTHGADKKHVLCRFNEKSVSYLTSKPIINMYNTGNLSKANEKKITGIMNSSCH